TDACLSQKIYVTPRRRVPSGGRVRVIRREISAAFGSRHEFPAPAGQRFLSRSPTNALTSFHSQKRFRPGEFLKQSRSSLQWARRWSVHQVRVRIVLRLRRPPAPQLLSAGRLERVLRLGQQPQRLRLKPLQVHGFSTPASGTLTDLAVASQREFLVQTV